MGKIHLINEYNLPIFDNSPSYWSMHFISILECIAYHKNLQYPAIRLNQTISSLAMMKGYYPNSFFDFMITYIQNWGMQYFMVHFLNHEINLSVVNHIKSELDDLFDIPNFQDYNDFEFYISGHDSELSINIQDKFDEIYPKNFDLNILEKENIITNSDICLVLKSDDRNIAIFGEIEGNYGDKLFQDSFWNYKSKFCVLGIGAVAGHSKGKFYIEKYIHLGKYPKINVIFEKSSYVVHDFYNILSEFRHIFNYGKSYYGYQGNFGYIINEIIIKNWNESILYILDLLYRLKDNSDSLLGEIAEGEIKLITPFDT